LFRATKGERQQKGVADKVRVSTALRRETRDENLPRIQSTITRFAQPFHGDQNPQLVRRGVRVDIAGRAPPLKRNEVRGARFPQSNRENSPDFKARKRGTRDLCLPVEIQPRHRQGCFNLAI